MQTQEIQEVDNLDNGVIEIFRKPLQKRIEKLYRKQIDSIINPEFKKEYEFPNLPGSYLKMRNPALELVKFICAVFSLSKNRNIEVRLLKKELLQIFDVKEFSSQANFINPSTSLRLPHVICDYCNHIRDVDLCRDEEINVWNCTACHRPYNKIALEEETIARLMKILTDFYSQDLQCDKCGSIRQGNLDLFCTCSGNWVETVNHAEVDKWVQVFANVGKYYNMQLLNGVLEEMI